MTKSDDTITQTEVTDRVRHLRSKLGLTQEEFAAKMGVGRVAALYWESGRSQPSAEVYVRMAKAAKEADPKSVFWFWEQIGIDREVLRDLIPTFTQPLVEAEQRVRAASHESGKGIVNIPILRGIGSSKEPLVAGPEQIDGWFPLPAALVPNPSKTSCIRAPKGMTALYGDDLVIVDTTSLPLERLWGKMVIAIRHSTGTAYAGFLQKLELDRRQVCALSQVRLNEDFNLNHITGSVDGPNSVGRRRKRNKRSDSDLLQLPGILLMMTPTPDWDILGHAICWISHDDQGWRPGSDKTPNYK